LVWFGALKNGCNRLFEHFLGWYTRGGRVFITQHELQHHNTTTLTLFAIALFVKLQGNFGIFKGI
jgi:hypothetical protein